MAKKSATPAADGIDDLLDDLGDDLTSDPVTPEIVKKGSAKTKKPDSKKTESKEVTPKASAEAKPDEVKKLEGLTKETEESGIIAFKKGSGSAHLLQLIRKFGFNRDKVLKAADKLKEAGKGFVRCEPAKKYNKVAGIIKNLQGAGYKLELEG